MSTAQLPERIGKYPVRQLLGEGATGAVYEAFDPMLQRPVAVRAIHRHLTEDANAATRLEDEAQAAGRLDHPAIAAVYEYGREQDFAYIATEFVAGHSLRDYLSCEQRFPEADIVSLMCQLLDAVEYAHGLGVSHRDIKPANIMIAGTGVVKVTDFGIAPFEGQDGVTFGTPGFMAPEQFSGAGCDHRVDVYAAGSVLYHLLTGASPYPGPLETVKYKAVTQDAPAPSASEGCTHWKRFDGVVAQALARDPARRFASARAFREALLAASAAPASAELSANIVALGQDAIAAATTRAREEEAAARAAAAAQMSAMAAASAGAKFDASALSLFEASLARHLGPMARILVQKEADRATDLAHLRDLLAKHLQDPNERAAFRHAHRHAHRYARRGAFAAAISLPAATGGADGSGAQVATVRASSSPALTPELTERATLLLAARVGPIAKVLVRKAAADAANVEALLHGLAASLDQGEFDLPAFRRELLPPAK